MLAFRNTSSGVHRNFLTKPKLRIVVKRPKYHSEGYPEKPKTIGERVKKKRMDMGLFQKDVARIIGVSTDTVTYWEKGRVKPSKKNLPRIKQFLRIKEIE